MTIDQQIECVKREIKGYKTLISFMPRYAPPHFRRQLKGLEAVLVTLKLVAKPVRRLVKEGRLK